MEKTLYTKDSIESLDPLTFTRLKPQIYAGNTNDSTQLVIEIFSNAVDEWRLGHGDKIIISINKDNSVTIQDFGQGFIPNLVRKDGKTVLEAAFSVLNTSAKFKADGSYEGTSLGSYGIGGKISNFLAHFLHVETVRDGYYEKVSFKEGVFEKREVGEAPNAHSGTTVHWQASEEFFTDPLPSIEKLTQLFKTTACLCPGLVIEFINKDKKETFYSKNGINDLIDIEVKNKEIINNRFILNYENGKYKIDMVLTYTSNYSFNLISYVNTGLTERGPHIIQIKALLTREFNKFFKDKKWLKDKDENLSGEDIQEGMYIIFNITAPDVAYDAQVKNTVTKIDLKPLLNSLSENLQRWMNKNEKEIKLIADKALNARKAREAAKKVRDSIRDIKSKKETGLKAKMSLSKKFTDCVLKDPKCRNLLLVEGQSASGSAIEARNPQTDCIYQLRGKVLSVLKTDRKKILENQEYYDIIKVIGAGFAEDFDLNKMQFNKIVITSDQDADGFNIELLLITFFYTYMKPLVQAGKLYRAVTPLYIIRSRNEEYYCYSEKEYANWKINHPTGYDVLRAKGLGELQPADLQKICFKDQRFKRITISDAQETTKLLNILMGPSTEPRKKYIYENATDLGFHFD